MAAGRQTDRQADGTDGWGGYTESAVYSLVAMVKTCSMAGPGSIFTPHQTTMQKESTQKIIYHFTHCRKPFENDYSALL